MFSAALLASGDRDCSGLYGFFRHSVDGEELGSGGPAPEGPRRTVSLIIRQSVDSSLSKMMQHQRRCKGFLLLHFLFPAVFLTISLTLFLRRMRILNETKEEDKMGTRCDKSPP